MSAFPQQRKELSLAKRFSRLAARLRDPEWQRYGKLLLIGKALGVGVVLLDGHAFHLLSPSDFACR